MSILADFLSGVQQGVPSDGTASVAFAGIRGGTVRLKPILKKTADVAAASLSLPLSPTSDPQSPFGGTSEPSPVKSTRKLRFSSDPPAMDRPGGELIPRPFAEFGDRRMSSSLSASHGVDSDLSPYAQRAVDRYRGNVTRLLGAQSPLVDRNHYHHYQSRLSPTSRVSRSNPVDELFEPVVKRPVDELHEGQIALLDAHVQQHLRHCESLLGISSTAERNTSAGGGPGGGSALVSQLASKLQRMTTEARWEHHRKETEKENAARTSPKKSRDGSGSGDGSVDGEGRRPPRFVAGGKCHPLDPPKAPTGPELIQRKREQREAIAALERLEHDPEVKRQARVLQALQECERKAEQYRRMIDEHEAERAQRNRGLAGSKTTPGELIALWRKEAEEVAEGDEMEERRDYARSQRKALRLEREEKRRAEDLLSGMTSLQLEEKRRKEVEKRNMPKKKRWRITKLGSVDAFAVPRWSSIPLVTLRGDVVVEEEESVVIQNVTWISTAQGWIPVQVAFNGMSRAQLFAESAENEGTGVVTAMLDELDDAHEKILDAMTICPPEQLKSQAEVKEQLKQMEFVRQSIRDLPGGRRDMIRRIWDDIQGRGGATRRLLDAAGERDEEIL